MRENSLISDVRAIVKDVYRIQGRSSLAALYKSTSGLILSTPQFQTKNAHAKRLVRLHAVNLSQLESFSECSSLFPQRMCGP